MRWTLGLRPLCSSHRARRNPQARTVRPLAAFTHLPRASSSCPTSLLSHLEFVPLLSASTPGWDSRQLTTPCCLPPSPPCSRNNILQLRIAASTSGTPAYIYIFYFYIFIIIYVYIFGTHSVYPISSCHFEECSQQREPPAQHGIGATGARRSLSVCSWSLQDFSGRKENLKASE